MVQQLGLRVRVQGLGLGLGLGLRPWTAHWRLSHSWGNVAYFSTRYLNWQYKNQHKNMSSTCEQETKWKQSLVYSINVNLKQWYSRQQRKQVKNNVKKNCLVHNETQRHKTNLAWQHTIVTRTFYVCLELGNPDATPLDCRTYILCTYGRVMGLGLRVRV